MKRKSNSRAKPKSREGGFFEGLGRWSSRHARYVVGFWLVIFIIAVVLYFTMFSENMTTLTKFTTATDSQLADDLFVERFPEAGYDMESHLVTSNRYTAEDPEFWTYIDGLCRKLEPLREQGIVKDVQYAEPILRDPKGLHQVPDHLDKMVAAMRLIIGGSPASEELLQASADLKASSADVRGSATRLAAEIMTPGAGQMGYDGMMYAADGGDELSASMLVRDALQKMYDALLPVTQGADLTDEVRARTVEDLKAAVVRLNEAAA